MIMSYGIVYAVLCKKTGMQYVGQTVSQLRKRWNGHLASAKSGSHWELSKAIREHGAEQFVPRVICECDSKEKLNELERQFIREFNTVWPHGYNMTNGGEGPCELTRKLISERTKAAMSKLDPSWKERQRLAMKDSETRATISDRTRSAMQKPEIKEKIAAIKQDPEINARISKKLKGHVVSEETREKIAVTLRSRPKKVKITKACECCKRSFEVNKKDQHYCSLRCYHDRRRVCGMILHVKDR